MESAKKAVVNTSTFPIAGGGTNESKDADCSPSVGVDKALTNLVVSCNLKSTEETVKNPGS